MREPGSLLLGRLPTEEGPNPSECILNDFRAVILLSVTCSWLFGLFWLFSSSLLSHPVGRWVLRCCASYTIFLKMSLPFRSHCPSPVSDYCGGKACLHGPSNYPILIFHDLPIGTLISGPFHSSVLPLLCLPWTLSQAACIRVTHPLTIQLKHLRFKCFSWWPSSNWFCLHPEAMPGLYHSCGMYQSLHCCVVACLFYFRIELKFLSAGAVSCSVLQRLNEYLLAGLNYWIKIIEWMRRMTLELSASIWYVMVGGRPTPSSKRHMAGGSK